MIRPYRKSDAEYLAPIHTAVFPDDGLSAHAFSEDMSAALTSGGRAWVIEQDVPIGYAQAAPVPGLPHIAELNGGIAPAWQRQGFGSHLLACVLSDLRLTPFRQASHHVTEMNSPAAQFLFRHGFYVEHEEWLLQADLHAVPQPSSKDGTAVASLPYSDAVEQFSELHSASFARLPWDQPYSRAEIEETLDNAANLLFLMLGSTPIGFAWLRLEAGQTGVIEPLGVLPAYQQRGYGRFLLLSALQELARRGASRVQIGAWRSNKPAIQLYESAGFKHFQTITYLAYDLIP